MADPGDILIFAKVAQFESITGAVRSLGTPISTVSRRLSVLEAELGVSLVRRATRRVSLTTQKGDYFRECQEPLNLLQEAERESGASTIRVMTAMSFEPDIVTVELDGAQLRLEPGQSVIAHGPIATLPPRRCSRPGSTYT